ncbi:MAG TPA: DUF2062 domain-containing protein [Tepidisphaeraceae bacterium]|nr:DUF2062 domain-containing protein [Tepidisphaeraceae bacterium]
MALATAPNVYAIIVLESAACSAGASLARLGCMMPGGEGLFAAGDCSRAGDLIRNAGALGCTHVAAISADADLGPEGLAAVMKSAGQNPTALVIGHRTTCPPPGVLRRIGNLLLRMETGHRLYRDDGPRVFPVGLIGAIDPAGDRHFGELEVLVRSAWAGVAIISVDLPESPAANPRQFHLISSRQTLCELPMHVRLIARALSGMRTARYVHAPPLQDRTSFWRMFWRWLNPFDAWRELRKGGASRNEMAVGLAVGAFIGNMPVWGFHTAISLYVARRLHLNPLAVMTGSHASAPPMGPLLIFSAMWTGHVILHGSRPKWKDISLFHGKFTVNALPLLLDWTLGAVLVGAALAIIVFVVANFLFRFVEKRAPA